MELDWPLIRYFFLMATVVIGPLLLSRKIGKVVDKSRLEAAARQDETVRRLLETTKELSVSNELVTTKAQTIIARLDRVHELFVNNTTMLLRSELDANRRALAIFQATGHPPSPETKAAEETARARVTEIEAVLEDRMANGRA